jgi:hypothetical protein
MVTLDKLHFRNIVIEDLVAILINNEYKSVKWLNQGSKSVMRMVTHAESALVGQKLCELFSACGEYDLRPPEIERDEFDNIRFIQKIDLGHLYYFHGFSNLCDHDTHLALIIDNHYHIDGQLEISLALSFNEDDIVVFDKWSTGKVKNNFSENTIQIDPNYDNFRNRNYLIEELSSLAYKDFWSSLMELKQFLSEARNFTIQHQTLMAVYLDLKDRNRSLTNLNISADNRYMIKRDLERVERFFRNNDQREFNYADFIRIIAKNYPHQFRYNPQFDFEITTSRAYNSLLKKQKIFSESNNTRRRYEEEQVQILINILPIVR